MKLVNQTPIALKTTRNVQFNRNASVSLAEVRKQIECEYAEIRAEHPQILRLALNEAEAIAGESGVPQLVFPVLAMEKAEAVSAWLQRQRSLRNQPPVLAFAA